MATAQLASPPPPLPAVNNFLKGLLEEGLFEEL